MYKDLSKYAEIANSIKPDLADIKVDDDIDVSKSINECANYGRKIAYRSRFESTSDTLPMYGIKSAYDTLQDINSGKSKDAPIPSFKNDDDGFDDFLKDFGNNDSNISDEEIDDIADDMNIEDYDPATQSHAEWLQKIMDKQADKRAKNVKKSDNATVPPEMIPKIDDKTFSAAKELVSQMKNNEKFKQKINDVNTPSDYATKAIEAFAKHYLKDDYMDVVDLLQSELKASHGDITQLYELYN